jgi:hypothetical protein
MNEHEFKDKRKQIDYQDPEINSCSIMAENHFLEIRTVSARLP